MKNSHRYYSFHGNCNLSRIKIYAAPGLYGEHSEIIEQGIARHFHEKVEPADVEKLKQKIRKVLEIQEN